MKTFLTAALGVAAAMLSTVSAEAAKFNYRFTYEQVDPFTQQGVGDFYTVAGTLDAHRPCSQLRSASPLLDHPNPVPANR